MKPATRSAGGTTHIGLDQLQNQHKSAATVVDFDTTDGHYRCFKGDLLGGQYEIRGELGRGKFGDVVSAFDHKTKTHVAVKISLSGQLTQAQALQEARHLHSVKRANPGSTIVDVVDVFTYRNHVFIVTEALDVDLYQALLERGMKGFDHETISNITADLLRGIQAMNARSLVHCDLKLENIMFRNREAGDAVSIIDFGSSIRCRSPVYGLAQSRYYRAPEVLLKQGFGPAIDMWSLGCIVAELHTGKPLFAGHSDEELLRLQLEVLGQAAEEDSNEILFNGNRSFYRLASPASSSLRERLGREASPEMLDFVARCLIRDPSRRLTPSQALSHPFLHFRRVSDGEVEASPAMLLSQEPVLSVICHSDLSQAEANIKRSFHPKRQSTYV